MSSSAQRKDTLAPQENVVLHVVADNQKSLQDEIGRAVDELRGGVEPGDRRGIMVTRRSRSLFTVEVSAGVPYGLTLERDRWHRSAPSRHPGQVTGQGDVP